ncbi:MAG TPA: aminodeoxychorismate synthase component I [Fibrobacteria bacterium]|nr:aminodeoxychorismate synthase component I [Fibrobacteria bacterium]
MKTLLLDNYDSFSHILFQYLWEVNGEKPLFVRNDEWTLAEIRNARFDNIVISPGPGHPGNARDFGVCSRVIAAFPDRPILGVCLGLQGLGMAAGVRVVPAPLARHGKVSRIHHDGTGLFAGLPQDFPAVRYHSLVLDAAETAGSALTVTATAAEDGQIMAIRFPDKPFHGVQFHPESIGTGHGMALLANFRGLSERWLRGRAVPVSDRPAAVPEILPTAARPPRVLEARELPWIDPEAAFARFFRDHPAAFWLDSLSEPVPGEPRMTYMGAGARLIEARGRRIRVLERTGDGSFPERNGPFPGRNGPFRERNGAESDPFRFLDAYLRGAETCRLPETLEFPGSFRGGLVGWFGYGLKRFSGGRDPGDAPAEPEAGAAAAGFPDAVFLEPDRILAFDPAARKVYAFLPLGPAAPGGPLAAGPAPEARAWLESLPARWGSVPDSMLDLVRDPPGTARPAPRLPWRLSAPREEYLSRIRALQAAILRGETYEACLTNEARARSAADPFEVYRRLRRTNPAPYAAYLRLPQGDVLSASPERFLKLDARGNLACRPIKGTRRRGDTPEEDRALREDLAGNAKDRSENLMIVDLVRNDFGKVCALGSVRAPDLMKVEEHPTVLQLVSTVTGRLEAGRGAIDAVRACFPGGSMTGAPKIRTMELLEAAERRPRGVFSGAMGYLGWDGAMDLGMVIRTLVHKDGEYSVGCGGAILAESDPEAEFAEAMLKAAAPMAAVELAEFGAAGPWHADVSGKRQNGV